MIKPFKAVSPRHEVAQPAASLLIKCRSAAGDGGAPAALETERDYSVMWRGTKLGRISYDNKPYAGEDSAASAYRRDSIEPRYARSHADRAPITRHAHN
jgi:hypothetical protein